MIEIVFYFFGTLTLLSALFILVTKNILHAALSLVIALLSIAALYVYTSAEFVAVTQIMIYVGGIVVLIIFGVMLTNDVSGKSTTGSINRLIGVLIAFSTLALLIYGSRELPPKVLSGENVPSIENLGQQLMTTYLLPFEVAAVLLLIALVAASVIAGNDLKSKVS